MPFFKHLIRRLSKRLNELIGFLLLSSNGFYKIINNLSHSKRLNGCGYLLASLTCRYANKQGQYSSHDGNAMVIKSLRYRREEKIVGVSCLATATQTSPQSLPKVQNIELSATIATRHDSPRDGKKRFYHHCVAVARRIL